SRRRHTRSKRDWSSDVCSSDLDLGDVHRLGAAAVEDHGRRAGLAGLVPECGPRQRPIAALEVFVPDRGRLEDVTIGVDDREPMRSEERRVGKGGKSMWKARASQ